MFFTRPMRSWAGFLLYDKRTGELEKQIHIPLPCGIAVEPSARIWVGHEHSKISLLSPEGERLVTPIGDLKDVRALSFSNGKLYVADRGASQLRIYGVAENNVWLQQTIGEPVAPVIVLPNDLRRSGEWLPTSKAT
jgi:hypothetical protein